jgi:hypothetical protein
MFRDCRLARMSDGHYCLLRDLGPVKGGKGMKHHEVVVDFTVRGVVKFLKGAIFRPQPSELPDSPPAGREGAVLTWRSAGTQRLPDDAEPTALLLRHRR